MVGCWLAVPIGNVYLKSFEKPRGWLMRGGELGGGRGGGRVVGVYILGIIIIIFFLKKKKKV